MHDMFGVSIIGTLYRVTECGNFQTKANSALRFDVSLSCTQDGSIRPVGDISKGSVATGLSQQGSSHTIGNSVWTIPRGRERVVNQPIEYHLVGKSLSQWPLLKVRVFATQDDADFFSEGADVPFREIAEGSWYIPMQSGRHAFKVPLLDSSRVSLGTKFGDAEIVLDTIFQPCDGTEGGLLFMVGEPRGDSSLVKSVE